MPSGRSGSWKALAPSRSCSDTWMWPPWPGQSSDQRLMNVGHQPAALGERLDERLEQDRAVGRLQRVADLDRAPRARPAALGVQPLERGADLLAPGGEISSYSSRHTELRSAE